MDDEEVQIIGESISNEQKVKSKKELNRAMSSRQSKIIFPKLSKQSYQEVSVKVEASGTSQDFITASQFQESSSSGRKRKHAPSNVTRFSSDRSGKSKRNADKKNERTEPKDKYSEFDDINFSDDDATEESWNCTKKTKASKKRQGTRRSGRRKTTRRNVKSSKSTSKSTANKCTESEVNTIPVIETVVTDDKEPGNGKIEFIPVEVLQRIFIILPDEDLQNCVQVCSSWRNIIMDSKFMPGKKNYHRLAKHLLGEKINSPVLKEEAKGLLSKILHFPESTTASFKKDDHEYALIYLFPQVISHFINYCPCSGAAMQPELEKHKSWPVVRSWFKERFESSLQPSSGEPYPWCFLAAIFVIAREMEDIEWVWSSLLRKFPENLCIIIDFLYNLAYILRLFTIIAMNGIWNRMQYRIIYRLRRLEFSGGVCLDQLQDRLIGRGQQSILRYGSGDTRIRLTHEQLKIARHDLRPGDVIRINAFAGTGKTTTLLNFARFNPNKKFILIVYNKAAQVHAEKIFPRNVSCRTGHSLAYQAVGRTYRHKLGNLKHRDLVDLLPQAGDRNASGNLFKRVKLVRNALENFMSSTEKTFSESLVTVSDISDRERSQAVREAEDVWKLMKDRDHPCPMPHDGYLKLWQISDPYLDEYDAILVDEAQDMNPCLLNVVSRQQQPKIFVGDPHQQIYSFRGSVNVLELIDATHVYSLTQSFRFGEPVAFVAQSILNLFKGESNVLTGTERKSSVHGDFDSVEQMTIICRNNATVFTVAHKIASRCRNSVHIIGGLAGLGVDLMLQIYYMTLQEDVRKERKFAVTDLFLKRFLRSSGSLVALMKYASLAEDVELLERIRVVQEFGERLPQAVASIRLMYTADQQRAHYIVTTAHKSKGLEFRSVVLASDLMDWFSSQWRSPRMEDATIDEINLLYVAATRAKYFLTVNKAIRWIMLHCGEAFCRIHHEKEDQSPFFKLYVEPLLTYESLDERSSISKKLELIPEEHLARSPLRTWIPLCGQFSNPDDDDPGDEFLIAMG